MYQIKCDGYLLHDDLLEDNRLYEIKLTLELNQLNSLEFTIYPQHEHYDKLQKLKSIITVERDDELIFRGRILDYEQGFNNQLAIVCEGELGFLLDSIVRPYDRFEGSQVDYFKYLIEKHNEQIESEKQFVIGQITAVTNTAQVTKSNTKHLTTWAAINEIIKEEGGYLTVDFNEEGKRRINYITEADFRLAKQEINFGENLIDLKTESKGAEIATAIIAVGGKIEGSDPERRLDITSLLDGQIMETEEGDVIEKRADYVYSHKAVEKYGWIFRTVNYDDVDSDRQYLQSVAVAELLNAIKSTESIELNAIDIAKLKLNVNSFNIATMVQVTSPKHNYNKTLFPITKITLNLLNPTSNTLSLQKSSTSFTEKTINNSKAQQSDQANKIILVESNVSGLEQKADSNATSIAETSEELTSLINQTAEEILSQMSEKHYLKDETNALVRNVETQIKQTSSEIEFRFNTFNQNVQDIQAGTDARFQDISKYIRFKDGNIILGEEGNELTLNIRNDRVSFLDHNTEVAYFSNRKLYVLDGEFLNVLRLGAFAFTPEANGSVSFKKVT